MTALRAPELRRVRRLAAGVPPGRAIVVVQDPGCQAAAAAAEAAPPEAPVFRIGEGDPVQLISALMAAGVRHRVRVIIAPPHTALSGWHHWIGLLCLPFDGHPAVLRGVAAPWADRVGTAGYLLLLGGEVRSAAALDLSPGKWDVYPGDGRIFLARRRPVG